MKCYAVTSGRGAWAIWRKSWHNYPVETTVASSVLVVCDVHFVLFFILFYALCCDDIVAQVLLHFLVFFLF